AVRRIGHRECGRQPVLRARPRAQLLHRRERQPSLLTPCDPRAGGAAPRPEREPRAAPRVSFASPPTAGRMAARVAPLVRREKGDAMKLVHRLFWGCLALAGLALGLAGAAPAQEKVTLKISHYLPPSHGFHTDFLGPWAQELERRTGGKVETEIYPVTSAFGDAARQADQVRAGVIDIALGLRGIPRGRFPASSVIELPFMVEDARDGSRVLWQLYK